MKKGMLAAQFAMAFICVQGGVALAAGGAWGDGPGCGLGQLAFANQPKTILHQVVGATLNGTGMQTFGISSGTSNCTNNGQIVKNEEVNVFASMNFENLSQEMAQGQGEHLTSLATLIGVPAEDQPAFFTMTQERYAALIEDGQPAPMAMLKALQVAMSDSPKFAKLVPQK